MKHLVITSSLLGLAAGVPALSLAQEVGEVISRTAVYQQVAVPRQTCTQTPVVVQSSSGAGALMGAIAGGAMGNSVGDGTGRALATMIGLVGGAMVGDRIEGPGPLKTQNHTTCVTQTVYENRLVGYNVVYVFAGKQYNAQLAQDPGPTILLNITPQIQSLRSPVSPSVQHTTIIQTPAQITHWSGPVNVPSPNYRQSTPAYSNINMQWNSHVARHPSHRYPAELHHAPRHKSREDGHHWR